MFYFQISGLFLDDPYRAYHRQPWTPRRAAYNHDRIPPERLTYQQRRIVQAPNDLNRYWFSLLFVCVFAFSPLVVFSNRCTHRSSICKRPLQRKQGRQSQFRTYRRRDWALENDEDLSPVSNGDLRNFAEYLYRSRIEKTKKSQGFQRFPKVRPNYHSVAEFCSLIDTFFSNLPEVAPSDDEIIRLPSPKNSASFVSVVKNSRCYWSLFHQTLDWWSRLYQPTPGILSFKLSQSRFEYIHRPGVKWTCPTHLRSIPLKIRLWKSALSDPPR